jgi:hypothetical protein
MDNEQFVKQHVQKQFAKHANKYVASETHASGG